MHSKASVNSRVSRFSKVSRVSKQSKNAALYRFKQYDESETAVQQLVDKSKRVGDEHAVHVEWLGRIQALWEELNNHPAYIEEKRVQNELKQKQKRLAQLIEDNKYEVSI